MWIIMLLLETGLIKIVWWTTIFQPINLICFGTINVIENHNVTEKSRHPFHRQIKIHTSCHQCILYMSNKNPDESFKCFLLHILFLFLPRLWCTVLHNGIFSMYILFIITCFSFAGRNLDFKRSCSRKIYKRLKLTYYWPINAWMDMIAESWKLRSWLPLIFCATHFNDVAFRPF